MGILFNPNGTKAIGGQALDILSAAFIKPISTIEAIFTKKKISSVVSEVNKQPLSTNIAATLTTTAIAATALYGGAAIAAGKGATLATSLIPKTLTGKVATALIGPAVAGVVIAKPTILEELPKIPAQTFELTKGLVSGNNIIDTIKENPYGAAAVAVGAGLIAKGIAGTAATILNTNAVKENTQATSNNNLPLTTGNGDLSTTSIQTNPLLPQVPATQRISSGNNLAGGKRRKYKHILPSMSQRVNVIVNNSQTTKKYLNRNILVYQ